MDPIATSRLKLRPLNATDRVLYIQLYTNACVMRHIGAPLPPERASSSFDKALALQGDQGCFVPRWILEDAVSARRAGLLGLFADPDGGAAEVGLMLLPEVQGRGFAGEAIDALVSRVLVKRWVQSVWARHAPANEAMARVLRAQGFLLELESPTECRWRLTWARWHAGASAGGPVVRLANKR